MIALFGSRGKRTDRPVCLERKYVEGLVWREWVLMRMHQVSRVCFRITMYHYVLLLQRWVGSYLVTSMSYVKYSGAGNTKLITFPTVKEWCLSF
jgi:hypothetical protein